MLPTETPVATSSPTTGPDRLRSHVVRISLGTVYAGVLLPSFGLIPFVGGFLVLSDGDRTTALVLLLVGAAMLYAAWPLLRRGQLPYLAILDPLGLRLEPRDRSIQMGKMAETVPLADIVGYSEEVANRNDDGAIQLTLFLPGGRKMRLADRPVKAIPADEPGPAPVTLYTLGQALQQQLTGAGTTPATLRRPNFYQSTMGRVLAGICWVCVAVGVVLLFLPGVDWTVGLRLFAFSGVYLGMYQRNRKLAA